jgi:hypothetical protein
VLAVLAGLPIPAGAHLVSSGLGPFYDGGLHLLLSPEDLLAVLAVSLAAGRGGKAAARSGVIALPGAWGAAGLAGLALGVVPELTWLNLGLLTLTAGIVAAGMRPRTWAMAALAICVGIAFGLDNGAAIAAVGGGAVAVAGITMAVAILTLLVSAAAVALRHGWMQIALRVVGSWIAAVGMLMLGWVVRGAA